MNEFISFDKIQAKTAVKRNSFIESERNFIIDKINEEIESAAEQGDIEATILFFNNGFNYIEPQVFIKNYCVEKLKENGYGVFADILDGSDVRLYINWGNANEY